MKKPPQKNTPGLGPLRFDCPNTAKWLIHGACSSTWKAQKWKLKIIRLNERERY